MTNTRKTPAKNPATWSQQELSYLRREFPTRPTAEIAAQLGRTYQAIAIKAHLLGLKKQRRGIIWTPSMLKLLKDYFPHMFNKPLAKWIGVSDRSLIRKARELGLEKRPGFLDDRREEISDLARTSLKKAYREGNTAGEFKKGHVESLETKVKRSAAEKAAWKRRKQREQFRKDYNINNN